MCIRDRPIEIDEKEFLNNLEALIDEANDNSDRIKEMTRVICDTYTITNN